ncbi:MAG: hypothetical protein KGS48_12360 [Bacteroidetes bacterium]|nr:hypothetical protein [Bacteroidota bacterium]
MSTKKEMDAWRAELIAKVFLLSSGFTVLPVPEDKAYDFLAIEDQGKKQKLAIEVLATRSSKMTIAKKFEALRESIVPNGMPVVLFYINSEKENGYFEVIGKNNRSGILPLKKAVFKELLSENMN